MKIKKLWRVTDTVVLKSFFSWAIQVISFIFYLNYEQYNELAFNACIYGWWCRLSSFLIFFTCLFYYLLRKSKTSKIVQNVSGGHGCSPIDLRFIETNKSAGFVSRANYRYPHVRAGITLETKNPRFRILTPFDFFRIEKFQNRCVLV